MDIELSSAMITEPTELIASYAAREPLLSFAVIAPAGGVAGLLLGQEVSKRVADYAEKQGWITSESDWRRFIAEAAPKAVLAIVFGYIAYTFRTNALLAALSGFACLGNVFGMGINAYEWLTGKTVTFNGARTQIKKPELREPAKLGLKQSKSNSEARYTRTVEDLRREGLIVDGGK
jgi:hypothetical protein